MVMIVAYFPTVPEFSVQTQLKYWILNVDSQNKKIGAIQSSYPNFSQFSSMLKLNNLNAMSQHDIGDYNFYQINFLHYL